MRRTLSQQLEIIEIPEDLLPAEIEAIVYEQDTDLLLKFPSQIMYPFENTEQLIRQAVAQPSLTLGTVLVSGQAPWRLLAIIHDLDQNPTWQEEWISQALTEIFHQVELRQIHSLAMPVLGSVHGQLSKSRFLELLHAALPSTVFLPLKRLWITTVVKSVANKPVREDLIKI